MPLQIFIMQHVRLVVPLKQVGVFTPQSYSLACFSCCRLRLHNSASLPRERVQMAAGLSLSLSLSLHIRTSQERSGCHIYGALLTIGHCWLSAFYLNQMALTGSWVADLWGCDAYLCPGACGQLLNILSVSPLRAHIQAQGGRPPREPTLFCWAWMG